MFKRVFIIGVGVMLSGFCLSAHSQEPKEKNHASTLVEVERLYKGGLKWLKRAQQPNGTFSGGGRDTYASQPGVVGLAVVAMLAHGDDPNFGPYAKNIKSGLKFILSQQNSRTGYIGSSMYNHGFASLALAEAYGTVLDP